MTARRTITIAAALAVTMMSLSSPATAGDPLEKLIRKVEKYVDVTYPTPRPTPLPYPLPYPRPAPCLLPDLTPWPEPGFRPLPAPAPAPAPASYFLGVYTSTVAVSLPGGGAADGPQAYVVPGYGEQVYGQRINSIVPNSPAFHAGLEPGDILVNANGIALDSDEILRGAIAESEGYMELQVLDSRSGALVWVVAETDPQSPVPAVASSSNLNTARTAFKTKSTQRAPSAKVGATRSTQRRVTSAPRQVQSTENGNRRPPVRRR
jgi:membrane-associated protease RseP (regulator of RpoE activity)